MARPALRHASWSAFTLVAFAVSQACTSSDDSTPPASDAGVSLGDSATSGSDGGPGPDASLGNDASTTDAAKPDGVVRRVSLHQLTAAAANAPSTVPAFSRNGARIAFSVTGGGANPNKIFVVDPDGSSLKQVDSYTPQCSCNSLVAISDDGNTVASTDGWQTRVVDLNAALKRSILFTGGVTSAIALDGNGSQVFMLVSADTQIAPSTNVERGLYKMPASGSTAPTQILGPAAVATLVGNGATPAQVFPFRGCVGNLAVSADGAKAVISPYVNGANAVIATNTVGAADAKLLIPPLTAGGKLAMSVGMSADGTKVAYFVNANNPKNGEVGVIGSDGTGRLKLYEGDPADGCSAPLTLTNDGALLAVGRDAVILPTSGNGEPWTVIAPTGAPTSPFVYMGEPDGANTRDMSMSGDGKRFIFLSSDGGPRHIGIAELDGSALGAVPTVTSPKVSRASIVRDGAKASMSAAAPQGSFVGGIMFSSGAIESFAEGSGRVALMDDGKNLDAVANDGTYTSPEDVRANAGAKVGARVLRIKAETKDNGTGKRAAHYVDFGPFAVE